MARFGGLSNGMTQSPRPTIFTIVSRNYAAQAAVLMESLARHQPTAERVVVVSDGDMSSLEVAGAKVVRAEDLMDAALVRAMSTYYSPLEFNTAIKPFCFISLLKLNETVVYLDPDIRLYDDLSPIWEAFDDSELLLTPHLLRPTRETGHPDGTDILRSGVYNLGFAGLRRSLQANEFAAWWADMCRLDCRVDFASGLFTDQRWVDLAPGFVERTRILRDPGLNVAYWNLPERPLEKRDGGWTADGEPLRFFHFSGFRPDRPDLLSKHQDRIVVRPDSALSSLLKDYATAMNEAGAARSSARPYGFSIFENGQLVTPPMRRSFLEAARSGRNLDDGLSNAQFEWLQRLEPKSIAKGQPQTWGGARWNDHALAPIEDAMEKDTPWLGPARQAARWLLDDTVKPDRTIKAFLRPRRDLQLMAPEIQGDEEATLFALLIGSEAAANRFAVDLLPPSTIKRLTKRPSILIEAARLWRPDGPTDIAALTVIARYGLAPRAAWPKALFDVLDQEPKPVEALWASRPDLQAAFDLRLLRDRLRLKRWLGSVGVDEYGLDRKRMPILSRASGAGRSGAARPLRPRHRECVVCTPTRLIGEVRIGVCFDTHEGRMVDGQALPSRVALCIHFGELAEAALGWIALYRQGIQVKKHLWAPATGAMRPTPEDPAWSFVDAVCPLPNWTGEYARPVAKDLPPGLITLGHP